MILILLICVLVLPCGLILVQAALTAKEENVPFIKAIASLFPRKKAKKADPKQGSDEIVE